MDATLIALAQKCLSSAHDGTMNFPTIVSTLVEAGFEGYSLDFRSQSATYFLKNGDCFALPTGIEQALIAATFSAERVVQAVREAQTNAPGYTYPGFCEKIQVAGCAGYMVSFLGKRVVYFGRTAETHVEHFPQ